MTLSTSSTTNEISLDALFACLGHRDRRRIVERLDDGSLRDVHAFVREETAAADGDRDGFGIGLHHKHLPMLEDHGLVDWDPDAGTVASGEHLDAALAVLDALER